MAAVMPTEHGKPVVGPSLEGSGPSGGFSPADLRSAYGLPSEAGEGQTIAITIAYDDPKAESDLAAYRSHFGLPPCTSANGCFKKVNQRGEEANYPLANSEWALEASLDLDMVSATCPKCHVLLVEADSNYLEDLGPAVQKASELGATVISDSWAAEEFSGETVEDRYFSHPGIPTLFASGDWGFGVYYPAASPDVVAVGGTSLRKAANSRGWSESAWSGAGSGCSAFESKPAWQKDEACSQRTVADVSAVADPESPVSVYDSYEYFGWALLGGTSVATPLMAGVEALSSSSFRAAGPAGFARAGNSGELFDVLEGENGPCARESSTGFQGTYLCQADIGYDGPTGWGTPDGPLSLPVAITEQATGSQGEVATLSGSVDPNGLATEYLFEYGETTAYGSSVPFPNGDAGSGSGYVELSQTVAGLKAETPYHYRITAINSAGASHGADRVFGMTPPSATTGSADEIRSGAAVVKGSVNPRGLGTSYYFEYGLTTSYGHRAPARAGGLSGGTAYVDVNAELTGLAGETPYHYRLVAKNAAGTTYGLDETFVTEPAHWVIADIPQPPNSGHGEEAMGVSCLPSGECVAVGNNWSLELHASATLAEWWDGATWEPMPTPNPPGLQEGWEHGRFATLASVSCTSTDSCVAVGYYKGTSELVAPLAERWDGTEWSLMEPIAPAGAESAALQSVSCTSPSQCEAAGEYVSSASVVKTMVERWAGTEWTLEPTPNPANAKETRLSGISCTSTDSCVAVGYYKSITGVDKTLAMHLEGDEWVEHETPNPGATSTADLRSVSCIATTVCVAVGGYWRESGRVPLAEHWNGTTWTAQSPPTPHEPGNLKSVSCTTATQCTAVGFFYDPNEADRGWRSLIERLSEGSWSVLEIARLSVPFGWWHEDWLWDVSCVEPEGCNAVGSHLEAPRDQLASRHAFSEHEVTPPFAKFSLAPSGPLAGETVAFDASDTSDPGHVITSYSWDFGDGMTGAGPEPLHSYARAGTYLVGLTVTDDIGRTGSVSRLVEVGDRPPIPSFTLGTAEPTATQPVAFDGSASSDPDGTVETYLWDFGDGSAGTGATLSHTYAHAGDYMVTLEVGDDAGRTAEVSHLVSVTPLPLQGFGVRRIATDCNGRVVLFLHTWGAGRFAATATASIAGHLGVRRGHLSRNRGDCNADRAGPENRKRQTERHTHQRFAYGAGSTEAHASGEVRLSILPNARALSVIKKDDLRVRILIVYTPPEGIQQTKSKVLMVWR